MSTFAGKITEIPGISVDKFDKDNQDSLVFFLSHCHTDHMVGLDNADFQKKIVDNERLLYLSHVSAAIIKRDFLNISGNLVELDYHSSTTVTVGDKYISVTAIPAGHCPGSIMFLFEGEKTVLYTGDYRLNSTDIPKLKGFYDSMNRQKKIDAVYLDTTFFLKEYEKFPPRAESVEEICSIIRDWTKKSAKHVIALQTSAKYGYENLFIEIFNELKMPIHVNHDIYQFYRHIPELDQAVTKFKEKTQIHSACGSHYTMICPNTIAYKVKTIKVSAFRWKSKDLQGGISSGDNKSPYVYVCYATHSSYDEGAALLKFLKPKKIEPNVLYLNDVKLTNEIYNNIREFLDLDGPVVNKKVKLFNVVEETEDGRPKTLTMDSCIFDSPPRM